MLPTIKLGSLEVTRLIIGGNPFSGNSHVNESLSEAMRDYFTTARIKETLFRCEEFGINTMQLRGDAHIMRMIREYRAEGGTMKWIGQTGTEFLSFENNVRQMVKAGADAIYHHGSSTDKLFLAGDLASLRDRLKILRDTGLPVGLCTHIPEVIRYSEEHGWDVDFYMGCVYNISRKEKGYDEFRAACGSGNDQPDTAIYDVAGTGSGIHDVAGPDGALSGEPFYDSDIPVMYDRIRKTSKPCLAFKILGATRRCASQETVRAAFHEAFREIKPTDGVIVGMFPKDLDQVRLNTGYVREVLGVE